MSRERNAYLVLLLVLSLVGGAAWLTHHPDHAVLVWAEGLPVVGSWAQKFRMRYRAPEPQPEPSTPAPEVRVLPREGPGQESPAPRWFSASDLAHGPPLGSGVEPVLPLPGRDPDPERLANARGALGEGAVQRTVGPYNLYTDVGDEGLLAGLDRLASELEFIYVDRYGVEPRGEAREAVVLFRRQQSYDSYESAQSRVSGLHAMGLAGHGVVALWQGDRHGKEVAATFVHEVAHLLNRRAIGPALPPWLDEGIADDLAQSRIGDDWILVPGELGGTETAEVDHRVLEGGRASLALLQEDMESGDLPTLEELTARDWDEFVLTDERGRNYAHASFLIRYLVNGDLAVPWRSFLAQVAAGGEASREALLKNLGQSWDELESGFRIWLRLQRLAFPGEKTRELG